MSVHVFIRPTTDEVFDDFISKRMQRDAQEFYESVMPDLWDSTVGQALGVILSSSTVKALCVVKKFATADSFQYRLNYSRIFWFGAASQAVLPPSGLGCLSEDESAKVLERLYSFPSLSDALDRIQQILAKKPSVSNYSAAAFENMALQSDAINLALRMGGIDVSKVMDLWTPPQISAGQTHISDGFLSGVQVRHDEDEVINVDARAWSLGHMIQSDLRIYRFISKSNVVTIANVNKTAAETHLGADLVIHGKRFNNAILIQYKMMERVSDATQAFYPNDKFKSQLSTMREVQEALSKMPATSDAGCRMSPDICFYKFCPRVPSDRFTPYEMMDGMILPLSFTEAHVRSKAAFSPDTIDRHLTNTQLKDLHNHGWIGTSADASTAVQRLVEDCLNAERNTLICDIVPLENMTPRSRRKKKASPKKNKGK